jgi:hypothetical protein
LWLLLLWFAFVRTVVFGVVASQLWHIAQENSTSLSRFGRNKFFS